MKQTQFHLTSNINILRCTVTKAISSDAATIAEIISEANTDVAKKFDITVENNSKHPSFCTKDWVLNDMGKGEEYFLLQTNFQASQQAIGCIAFERKDNSTAYLNRLAVLPSCRNIGAGEQLVRYVLNLANENQHKYVSIGVIAEHTQLVNWYLKLGFISKNIKTFAHLPFNVQFMTYSL